MKTYPKIFSVVALLMVIGLVLGACGGEGNKKLTPTPTSTQTTETEWYWKPGGFIDYALSGMPDFDQKQDAWSVTAAAPTRSYCGPVAMANSLWWFDSEMEPNPVAPPVVNDNYKLVEAYSIVGAAAWDDHDTKNVMPFVNDLAMRMDTDGQKTGDDHTGTYIEDMAAAINQYLIDKGLDDEYYVHVVKSPEFDWIAGEIKRCQDVVLLLGFWQLQSSATHAGEEWVRVGGHYVTCAGVNTDTSQLGVSDPYRDNAEAGGAGVVPVAHTYPHNSSVHNEAKYVSHDIFNVSVSNSPGGLWKLDGYAGGIDITNFIEQNWAEDLLGYQGGYNSNSPVQTEIDYAIAVSPVEPTPTPSPTPTPTQVRPTPTPTPTPRATPILNTPAAGQTPVMTPSTGGSPTPRATPTPTATPKPCSGGPVVTGIHSTHKANPTGGGFTIEMHCLPAYFSNGSNIYDVHFWSGGVCLGSEYFETPLVPCTTYTFNVSTPTGGGVPECITICLTDQNHNPWGSTASWLVSSNVQDNTMKAQAAHWLDGQVWKLGLTLSPQHYDQPTNFYGLHFETLETSDGSCVNMPVGDGNSQSQSPLVPGETYYFDLPLYQSTEPLDVVVIEYLGADGSIMEVGFSWPE